MVTKSCLNLRCMQLMMFARANVLPLTFQFFVRPPTKLTGLACELILDILIFFTGSTDPAAAHFSLPDNLIEVKCHFLFRESDLCSANC